MASIWAKKRAEAILEQWANNPGLRMKDLIADELDTSEEEGYERGYSASEELKQEVPTAP